MRVNASKKYTCRHLSAKEIIVPKAQLAYPFFTAALQNESLSYPIFLLKQGAYQI